MSVSTEIEKRFQVISYDLDGLLDQMVFEHEKRIVDEYLDTVDGVYYRNGIFIRIRNSKSLDIKFNPAHLGNQEATDHVTCSEYNFQIPFNEDQKYLFDELHEMIGITVPQPFSLQGFIDCNKLISLVTLDKTRKTYTNHTFIIAVDYLGEFGTFIEFESKDGTRSLQEFIVDVGQLTKGLSLAPFDSGYVELALRQTNEDLYRQGKYLIRA